MDSTHPDPGPALREDCLDYPASTDSVGLARHRAARLVRQWLRPELAWVTALLVSELATNAVLHGGHRDRPFRVRIALTGAALRIEVSDGRPERLPSLRTAEDDECFGRGLLLVAELADHWGVHPVRPQADGKTVYAEIRLDGSPAPGGA